MKQKQKLDIGSIARTVSYGDRTRPVRDWFLLVTAGALLLVASAGWNLWLLKDVERTGPSGDAAAVAAFDAAPIESVRAMFEARAAEEAKYVGSYRFVDPSR